MSDRIEIIKDDKGHMRLIAAFELFDPMYPNYIDKKYAYNILLKQPHGLDNVTKMNDHMKKLRELADMIETDLKRGVYSGNY